MKRVDTIVVNAGELLTMLDEGIVAGGAFAVEKGLIAAVGTTAEIAGAYAGATTIDAKGRVVTPGLIDPHTHLIFAGTREQEFEMRIKGASYMEIARAGGGILSTVEHVRKASKKELKNLALERLAEMLAHGTTIAEVKSGYGLNLEDEIKMLEVVAELNGEQPIELIPTFLGAHEVPAEYKGRKEDYVRLVIDEIIPRVGEKKLARFCDVFCEEGVFSVEQSRAILTKAREYGMVPKLHADEFICTNGAVLAADVGAVSADHLLAISDDGIKALKRAAVVAVLLPGTTYSLGLKNYAPARRLIEEGVVVALGSDFNPGSCMSSNLQAIVSIACTQMKMTPYEALAACTVNAAAALGIGDRCGSLERGKEATFILWKTESHRYIPYHFGSNHMREVYIRGKKA